MSNYTPSVIDVRAKFPFNVVYYLSNKPGIATAKINGNTIKGEEAVGRIIDSVFYHIVTVFRKRKFSKDGDIIGKSSYYTKRGDAIKYEEKGIKFEGTVNEFQQKNPGVSTEMSVLCVAESKSGELDKCMLTLTLSGRNETFKGGGIEAGSIFKVVGRATTNDEVQDNNYGEYVYYLIEEKVEDGRNYDKINDATKKAMVDIMEFLNIPLGDAIKNVASGMNGDLPF